MHNEETIDFSKVDVASNGEYLQPGMYRLKVDPEGTKVEEPAGKTPYLSVRFVAQDGASLVEKFFLTAKALSRLQYLHKAWFGKELDRTFKSFTEVGNYFRAALTSKIVTRPMVTGGKISPDGKFYSGLPYTDFVIIKEELFEEGPFDKDSDQYKRVVQVQKPNPIVAGNDGAILPSASGNTSTNDLPW